MTEKKFAYIIGCPHCFREIGIIRKENIEYEVKKVVNKGDSK